MIIIFLGAVVVFFMRASCHYKPQRDKAANKKKYNKIINRNRARAESKRIDESYIGEIGQDKSSWAGAALSWVELRASDVFRRHYCAPR